MKSLYPTVGLDDRINLNCPVKPLLIYAIFVSRLIVSAAIQQCHLILGNSQCLLCLHRNTGIPGSRRKNTQK